MLKLNQKQGDQSLHLPDTKNILCAKPCIVLEEGALTSSCISEVGVVHSRHTTVNLKYFNEQ